MIQAGVLLGLSVASNLTFAIPGIGLGLMIVSAIRLPLVLRYLGSVLLTAIPMLAVPLASARTSEFYYGQPDAAHSILNLSYASLFYHGRMPLFFEWTESYLILIRLTDYWVAPLVLLGMGLVLSAHFQTAPGLRLAGGSLFISILLLVLGHQAVGLKYPYDRTGLYLIFLFPLAFVTAAELLYERGRFMRWVTAPWIAAIAGVLVLYCLQFHTGDFAEWAYAADVNRYMQEIGARSPSVPVRIGGSFVFSYLVNFYREKHRSHPLASFENPSLAAGYDYYLLLPEDRQYVDRLALHIVSNTGESIFAARR